MRAVYSAEPDLGKAVVRTLSRLVRKIYWTDFADILYIVYCSGLVVSPPSSIKIIGTPLHAFFWGGGGVKK